MSTETKTVIEINGVKMEVDLRHARRVENIGIGTRVKVLAKFKCYWQPIEEAVADATS